MVNGKVMRLAGTLRHLATQFEKQRQKVAILALGRVR